MLVGNPNVGKSLIFQHLTGKYATVSNYPGTTVDITVAKLKGSNKTLIDTPGMYSLVAITEEERVAKKILLEGADIVVHVVDAKNLKRMLPFTIQLIEAGFNTILVLNAIDEAEKLGMEIDSKLLSERLGIPVVKTIATQKMGIDELKKAIFNYRSDKKEIIKLNSMDEKLESITRLLDQDYPISKKMIALLILLGDKDTLEMVRGEKNYQKIVEIAKDSNSYEIFRKIQECSDRLLDGVIAEKEVAVGWKGRISELSLNPIVSIPMTVLSLYILYLFAGVFGAQFLVELIESSFERYINQPLNMMLNQYIPNYWIRELIGGDYGIITLGLRYAIAIIFPIVTTFFIAFSVLEDSGFLPRMASLLNSTFKKVGLSGRAVIPLLLGLGCGTMATIVTRTLETKKERIIATLLLAVGIPCSAQMGVMMGIAPDFRALMIWITVISLTLIFTATLASRAIEGEDIVFFMEIPPLRMPNFRNIIFKTVTRLEWYFKEVMPIFILISVFIWIGRITGVFDLLVNALAVPSTLIGLPSQAGLILLYGFFRRDYGAAGLYDLVNKGIFSYNQVIVAMVTLTLFVPCIAQFSVMCKERGLKSGIGIFIISLTVAFAVGYLTNLALGW
ncbi:ferrous iron transporter FeoB [Archaeoglobus sulfaticallidus PM70-1]|uniref:Ferrous iron transport protein B n=1 Tax=Archaeoglobus sulfaticallidus PM70-1 TaxID=387631 RepID=N0BKG3_9EURY|nr:ferrous iron transporter FeoB [Archaeoglobus sulfaticallidus PM70-1]